MKLMDLAKNIIGFKNDNDKKELEAKEFFDKMKMAKKETNNTMLEKLHNNIIEHADKALSMRQFEKVKRCNVYFDIIQREKKLLENGFTTYIERDVFEEYLQVVKDRIVKVQVLEEYERDIPDELKPIIDKSIGIFDDILIVFTDYSKTAEKKQNARIDKRNKEKDPIMFGTFIDRKAQVFGKRIYFLGDWIDEHCDLQLSEMIEEVKLSPKYKGTDILKTTAPLMSMEYNDLIKHISKIKNGEIDLEGVPTTVEELVQNGNIQKFEKYTLHNINLDTVHVTPNGDANDENF